MTIFEDEFDTEKELIDGFQELFSFRQHNLVIKGFHLIVWSNTATSDEEHSANLYSMRRHLKQHYISWDAKQLLLWERNQRESLLRVVNTVKFPLPNFIFSVIPVSKPKMKIQVILAAALDMSFKIYDRNLNLLESIKHEERAILQLIFDQKKDIILSSGASGISVWKLYKMSVIDTNHIIEKLFTFESCNYWVSKMIYEPSFERIYVMNDRNVKVFNLSKQTLQAELTNAHQAPVTAICWFARNQFYVTGCRYYSFLLFSSNLLLYIYAYSRGEIKCWTANYYKKGSNEYAAAKSSSSSNKFALLHTFQGHTDAVSCIMLHTVAGLAMSCSLDGTIKILNLEYLIELYVINLGIGILDMKLVPLGDAHGCLFSLADDSIKLWQITSYTRKFGVLSAPVSHLEAIENIHLLPFDVEEGAEPEESRPSSSRASSRAASTPKESSRLRISVTKPTPVEATIKTKPVFSSTAQVNVERHDGILRSRGADAPIERVLMARSAQDVIVYGEDGTVLSRMEADQIVINGVTNCALSLQQKKMFCLCDNDMVRVYSLLGSSSVFQSQFSVRSKSDINLSDSQIQSSCLAIISIRPESELMMAKATSDSASLGHSPASKIQSSLGLPASHSDDLEESEFEEYLLVGMKTGAILFIDPMNNCELLFNFKAFNGSISALKYRRSTLELIIFGMNVAETSMTVRVLRLPDLSCKYETTDLTRVSCFEVAQYSPLLAFGCSDGNVRIFTTKASLHAPLASLSGEVPSCLELPYSRLHHEAAIHCVSFSHEMGVYATCASDSCVKIWECGKGLIRSIRVNQLCYSVAFGGNYYFSITSTEANSKTTRRFVSSAGDVRITQGNYILNIPKNLWDDRQLYSITTDASTAEPRIASRVGTAIATNSTADSILTATSTGGDQLAVESVTSIRKEVDIKSDEFNADFSERKTGFKRTPKLSRADFISKLKTKVILPPSIEETRSESPKIVERTDSSPRHFVLTAKKDKKTISVTDAFEFVPVRLQSSPQQSPRAYGEPAKSPTAINVRRPRFLIRKKPSFKPSEFKRTIENDFAEQTRVDAESPAGKTVNSDGTATLDISAINESSAGNSGRSFSFRPPNSQPIRSTFVGLSPRARLTLLNVSSSNANSNEEALDIAANENKDISEGEGDSSQAGLSTTVDNLILESSRMTISDAYKRHREYLRVGKERAYQQSFRLAAGSRLQKSLDAKTSASVTTTGTRSRRGNLQAVSRRTPNITTALATPPESPTLSSIKDISVRLFQQTITESAEESEPANDSPSTPISELPAAFKETPPTTKKKSVNFEL